MMKLSDYIKQVLATNTAESIFFDVSITTGEDKEIYVVEGASSVGAIGLIDNRIRFTIQRTTT